MELALFQLLALRLRGGLRTRLQQLLSVRGLVYFCISCFVPLIIWIGLHRLSASTLNLSIATSVQLETFMVLGLVAATLLPLLTASSPAFHYSPEEVQFLRAGPFSRQSLVLYKIFSAASGAALTGLILASATFFAHGRFPTSVFFGTLLTLLFVRLSSATVRSAWRLFAQMRLFSSLPQVSSLLLACTLGLLAWLLLASFGGSLVEALLAFCETPTGEFLLLPFKAFVRVTLADRMFPDLILWSAFAVAINLFLLLLLLRLDSVIDSCMEDEPSENRSSELQSSGDLLVSSSAAVTQLLPYRFGGVGPIVWRQLVRARRSAGTALLGLTVLAILGGPILVQGLSGYPALTRIGIAVTFAIFVLPKTMTFDFRGDATSLSWLKGLPLRADSIALGQLMTPVILTSCIELLFLGSTICLLDESSYHKLLALVPFVLPFNLLLYSIENGTFLLVPFRVMPTGRIDFEFFGRSVFEVLTKMLLLSLMIAVSARAGRLVSSMANESAFVFYATTWLALSFAAALAVWIVALIFKRSEHPSDVLPQPE